MLVVFYSHTGNTRTIARHIQALTGCDLLDLEPVTPYPRDYDTVVSQAKKEKQQGFLPPLKNPLDMVSRYDVILVGSPSWWGTFAGPVRTFLSTAALDGKTLIPFITHEGSGLGSAPADLRRLCPSVKTGEGLAEAGIGTDRRGWVVVDDALKTSLPEVYAIGDLLGPSRVMLAHVAAMEGLCVVESLCGKPRAMRYDAVPSGVFTSPEVGSVGLSEQQAREQGLDVRCVTFQMRELGKAQAMGELPGFFKLVAAADGGRLLGAHIVGAHASDLVAEAALGVANGLTLEQVAHTIHAHPTLAEGLYEAALLAQEA